MKNTYEVGVTPDDNNDRRLPGSVQPEPQRGDSSYHHLEMAKAGPLDTADTGGVVGMPSVGADYAMGGIMKSASTAGPTGVVETTASEENRAAKYKYPTVSQDIPPLGNPKTQYSDHS